MSLYLKQIRGRKVTIQQKYNSITPNGDGLKLVAPLLIKDMKMKLTDKPSEQIF